MWRQRIFMSIANQQQVQPAGRTVFSKLANMRFTMVITIQQYIPPTLKYLQYTACDYRDYICYSYNQEIGVSYLHESSSKFILRSQYCQDIYYLPPSAFWSLPLPANIYSDNNCYFMVLSSIDKDIFFILFHDSRSSNLVSGG